MQERGAYYCVDVREPSHPALHCTAHTCMHTYIDNDALTH